MRDSKEFQQSRSSLFLSSTSGTYQSPVYSRICWALAFFKWESSPSLAPAKYIHSYSSNNLPIKTSRHNFYQQLYLTFIYLSSPSKEFMAFIISQQCITLHLISEQSSSKDMQFNLVCLESNGVFPDKSQNFTLICFKIWYRFFHLLWQASQYYYVHCRDAEAWVTE